MTNKDVQLLILRHLEAGNTTADLNLLTEGTKKQRENAFVDGLMAIECRGFLCPRYTTSDEPSLQNAYVSADGRAFLKENTQEPPVQIIVRHSLRWIEMAMVAIITALATTLVHLWITPFLK
jgi:hypothetical protein